MAKKLWEYYEIIMDTSEYDLLNDRRPFVRKLADIDKNKAEFVESVKKTGRSDVSAIQLKNNGKSCLPVEGIREASNNLRDFIYDFGKIYKIDNYYKCYIPKDEDFCDKIIDRMKVDDFDIDLTDKLEDNLKHIFPSKSDMKDNKILREWVEKKLSDRAKRAKYKKNFSEELSNKIIKLYNL